MIMPSRDGLSKLISLDDISELSRAMRRSDFCLCENKGADQLCSNCTADQRHCFCYTGSPIPPLAFFLGG